MKLSLRWYGPQGSVPLTFIRQIPGVKGVVSRLHDIAPGDVWPDHGRMIWKETGNPGYGLFDRALGPAYINGMWEALSLTDVKYSNKIYLRGKKQYEYRKTGRSNEADHC